jgi:hypothetical protein
MTCYNCTHRVVCPHLDRIFRVFPVKDDAHISPLYDGCTKVFAENCRHYEENK